MFKIPIITITVMAKSEFMNTVYNWKVLIERTNQLYSMLTVDLISATLRRCLHLPLITSTFLIVAQKLDGMSLNRTLLY